MTTLERALHEPPGEPVQPTAHASLAVAAATPNNVPDQPTAPLAIAGKAD